MATKATSTGRKASARTTTKKKVAKPKATTAKTAKKVVKKKLTDKVNTKPFLGLFGGGTASKAPAKKRTTATAAKRKAAPKKAPSTFIKDVSKLANEIHEQSFTGKTKTVKVYGISRKQASKRAVAAYKRAKGSGVKISNLKLKA